MPIVHVRAPFWIAVFSTLLLSSGIRVGSAIAAGPRPNVIVVLVDDLGWADLGCYGSKFHRTPNLDRMAAEGMRFTQAYSACPVCSPSRAALMTGRYPARLHLTDWLPGQGDTPEHKLRRPEFRQELPLEEVTIAETLHGAGYRCATVGKWHLGGAGYEPTRQGFDLNVAGDHTGSPWSYFAPYQRGENVIPGLENAPEGEYLTDRLFDEAVAFIDAQGAGAEEEGTAAKVKPDGQNASPFFLYLPLYAVHTPLKAKQPMIDRFEAAKATGLQRNSIYAAMLESVDEGIGRLLARLDALAIADNTVIFFTSDNGGLATTEGVKTPATYNGPLREGKGYLYEGGIRVPLLVRWPKHIAAGSTCDEPVSGIDFLPTIVDLCDVKLARAGDGEGDSPSKGNDPAVEAPAVDGVSIAPLLEGKPLPVREALYWHYPHYSNQGGRPGGVVRAGDFKLIEYYENGRQELFNVKKDTSESANLVAQMPELAAKLQEQLAKWRQDVGAQMMTANAEYTPNPQADDGVITLPAATAEVHGVMLRYEPLPHKNTLGFWVKENDWAQWEFQVTKPGEFKLLVLQGCGKGSGGSRVEFTAAEQTRELVVEETGGFQDFVEREVGRFTFAKPGRYTLSVRPQTKPGPAVMDLRQAKFVPVSGE